MQLRALVDVHSYMITFTRIPNGTIEAFSVEADTFWIGQQKMRCTFQPPTELMDKALQPDPWMLGPVEETKSAVFLNTADYVANINDTTRLIEPNVSVTVGEWQAQIMASRLLDDGTQAWSKYSDAVPFYARSDARPFNVPAYFNLTNIAK